MQLDESPMAPLPTQPPPQRARRRWWQWRLSVRGLMLLVLVIGGVIGWEANRVARMRQAIAVLEGVEGKGVAQPIMTGSMIFFGARPAALVRFAEESSANLFGHEIPPAPWLPPWLTNALGVDHFKAVRLVEFHRRPTSADWDAIARLGSVTALDFRSVRLEAGDLDRLPECRQLRSLTLDRFQDKAGTFAAISAVPGLRSLGLMSDLVTAADLPQIRNLAQLEEVFLSGGAATDPGLVQLEAARNLRVLGMGFSGRVTDRGLEHLRGMTRLERLSFLTSRFTDGGMAILRELPQLRALEIEAARTDEEPITLSPAGLRMLGELTRLEELKLADSNVLNDTWMVAIGRLTRLRSLEVVGNGITDAGLAPLAALQNLEEVRIGSLEVTDAGLVPLRSLSHLAKLTLDTLATLPGVAALRTTLPSLKDVQVARWSAETVTRWQTSKGDRNGQPAQGPVAP